MTRQEFLDEITTIWELLNWCSDNNCYIYDEIQDQDGYDEWISDLLSDRARDWTWQDIESWLSDLPQGYEYYRYSEDDDSWEGVGDYDFTGLRDEALEWGDENGVWDQDEDEEEPDDPEPEPEPERAPIAAFDMDDIMSDTREVLLTYRRRSEAERAAEERAAAEMIRHG